jgi:uncharacterized membrane protein
MGGGAMTELPTTCRFCGETLEEWICPRCRYDFHRSDLRDEPAAGSRDTISSMLGDFVKTVTGRMANKVINAPVHRVFSYLADFTRHPEWFVEPQEGRQIRVENVSGDKPLGPGSRFKWVVREGSSDDSFTLTVVDFTPDERVGWSDLEGTARHQGYDPR